VVKLWDLVQEGNHPEAKALHANLLRFWNALITDNLPANIKYAQSLQGVPFGLPRAPMQAPDADRKAMIAKALEAIPH
jgi:4-hydroxy-tetrahydrodipicolinate synthase